MCAWESPTRSAAPLLAHAQFRPQTWRRRAVKSAEFWLHFDKFAKVGRHFRTYFIFFRALCAWSMCQTRKMSLPVVCVWWFGPFIFAWGSALSVLVPIIRVVVSQVFVDPGGTDKITCVCFVCRWCWSVCWWCVWTEVCRHRWWRFLYIRCQSEANVNRRDYSISLTLLFLVFSY